MTRSPSPTWIDYARLVRLPNVFTVWADVLMGYLFTHAAITGADVVPMLLLVIASSGFYWYGMVLNDLCDVRIDRRERPGRPLPSRRISLKSAKRLTLHFFSLGFGCTFLLVAVSTDYRPLIFAGLLFLAIRLYNRRAKHHAVLGPITMGACRTFNVLLGMSLFAGTIPPCCFGVAIAIGCYIASITYLARIEAEPDLPNPEGFLQAELSYYMIYGSVGFMVAWLYFCMTFQKLMFHYPLLQPGYRFLIFMPTLLAVITWPRFALSLTGYGPTAAQVRTVVKWSILGLIALDASIAYLVQGYCGLYLLLLFIPSIWLGRRVYST